MLTIELNGETYLNVFPNETIIQSCSRLGEEIPRFCFHEKLSIAGNCRMCLVELGVPRSLKPVASCALPVVANMKIFTNTALVKKARESVLEFLLANHPLDCPICDQGGECDLQDETMLFGNDRGRFYESKRSVEDKECGPIIKTVMTRCIHCTRCVRFFSEIVGSEAFGVMGRGSSMEIGTYIEKIVDSELSGNVIDLCPVGALTAKPYAFIARPWELRSVQSVDVLDSMCSSIRVDVRGTEVVRILPLVDNSSNEEWISDKTRFFYDSLKTQRLQSPLFKWNTKFFCVDWVRVFSIFKNMLKVFMIFENDESSFFQLNKISKSPLKSLIGRLTDAEALVALKDFSNAVGSEDFFITNDPIMNFDFKFTYIFNSFYNSKDNVSIFNKVDLCLLFNFNPRFEMPLLNIKLRRSCIENKLLVLSISSYYNLNYFFFQLSNHVKSFLKILCGKHFFCRKLAISKYPLIISSTNLLYKIENVNYIQNILFYLTKYVLLFNNNWIGLNLIINKSHLLSSFELGVLSSRFSNHKFFSHNNIFYLLGSENPGQHFFESYYNNFYIYQGHHGDELINIADIVFPSLSFIEKVSTFLSFEGYLKRTKQILSVPGIAKSDWQIITSFFLFFNQSFLNTQRKNQTNYPFNTKINQRLAQVSPFFIAITKPIDRLIDTSFDFYNQFFFSVSCIYRNIISSSKDNDFFLADPLTRSSKFLSLSSKRFNFSKNFVLE